MQRISPWLLACAIPMTAWLCSIAIPLHNTRGFGRLLIEAVEQEAKALGVKVLSTEASLISKPLFEQLGWLVSWREELRIGGVPFLRFRMHKQLQRGY